MAGFSDGPNQGCGGGLNKKLKFAKYIWQLHSVEVFDIVWKKVFYFTSSGRITPSSGACRCAGRCIQGVQEAGRAHTSSLKL